MATDDSGFFSRWSRRKAQAAEASAAADPAPPKTAVGSSAPPALTPSPGSPAPVAALQDPALTPPVTDGTTPARPGAAPPPTMDDVARLTPESDFKPFVGRTVSPQVKNAAMKKLFADPHFNVMDGLDIYIDDYSRPDPLPAELLKKMVSAQFMKLVDEEAPAAAAQRPAPGPASGTDPAPAVEPADSLGLAARTALPMAGIEAPHAHPDADVPLPAALSPAAVPVPTPTATTAHDHLDLQLQPDHAPRRGGTGSGAG